MPAHDARSLPVYPPEGPNPTTFGPLALLGRSRTARVLTGVAALAWVVLAHLGAGDGGRVAAWMMLLLGLVIGYLSQRRRAKRPGLQIGLAVVLPTLLTAFFMWVSRGFEPTVASSSLIPATLLGHLLARLVERWFGPREKVRTRAWAGVTHVGANDHPGVIFFDVRGLFGPVSRDEIDGVRPYVRGSSLRARAIALKWLFIIVAPILLLALVTGFMDEATKDPDDMPAQLVGLSAITFLLIVGYAIIAWFGFRGTRHATSLKDHTRFARFAHMNGFGYAPGPVVDRFGQQISRVMTTADGGWTMGNATRTEPQPQESSAAGTFFSGFSEFQGRVSLPNILLVSRRPKLPAFSAHAAPRASQRLKLEGDFNRYFDVYCPAGYERDALYLLTPDVMARFIDGVNDFDFEFIDNRVVLRTRGDMVSRDPGRWQRIAIALNAINDRAEQWERWGDDRLGTANDVHGAHAAAAADGAEASARADASVGARAAGASTRLIVEKPTGVALAGQRLRAGLSVGGLLAILGVGLYVGLTVLANAL